MRGGCARAAAALVLCALCCCRAATLEPVTWSRAERRFSEGQGLVLYPQIGDKMDIVCPRAETPGGGGEEFYRVYMVTRRQMERCVIDKTDTPLLSCDKPQQDVKFTFKFQEFSPNLWGLEFLRGRDYYITSTSSGSLQGLENTSGGACRSSSMKMVLRVGQSPSDPPSTLQESPTRFPPKSVDGGPGSGSGEASVDASPWLLWVASGCGLFLLVMLVPLAALWVRRRRRRRRRPGPRRHGAPDPQQASSVPLNTLAATKRDSVSSDNDGSDRSDVVFPRRPSESMICRHYERVSGDYGPPVYIMQEIGPQPPTNIFYKV